MVTVCCLQEVLLQLRWEELEEAGEGKEQGLGVGIFQAGAP